MERRVRLIRGSGLLGEFLAWCGPGAYLWSRKLVTGDTMKLHGMTLFLCLGLGLGCAHNEMTADEHRLAAQKEEAEARKANAKFDPNATVRVPMANDPNLGPPGQGQLESYNPTAGYLEQAATHQRKAHEHDKAASSLEKFEDSHCGDLSPSERAACPLFTAFVQRVEETKEGVKLHLKDGAPEAKLLGEMQCHLAYAKAHGFEQVTCPLYLRGVSIEGKPDHVIELRADSGDTAKTLREQARGLFGSH